MLISAQPQLILAQAEKVKKYQQIYQQNLQRMDSNINQLSLFWQGQEAKFFISSWLALKNSNTATQQFNQALIDYAANLNRIGNLYLEAQKQALLTVNRL
ncbi:MAG: WXG100 family type VII secretion target [Streptococcaceae bacterium]|jgi:uncharacterized protein YukE|nr:WXG100 family type VII secretion target [Streptococcaceae bacterium]MCH4176928.1 WXG100 family type VII secretion target [Streptococcaceae bacterium]